MEIRYSQRVRQWWYNMHCYRSSICSVGTSALPSSFLPVFLSCAFFLCLCYLSNKRNKACVQIFPRGT